MSATFSSSSPMSRRTTRARVKRGPKPLDPAVFRKAAQRIDEESSEFACNALVNVLGMSLGPLETFAERRDALPEVRFFTKALRPPELKHRRAWYSTVDFPYRKTARVLGLLLCAELIENGVKL